MQILVQRIFPVILLLGAGALALHEWRSPFREGRARLRRFRRVLGAGMLSVMAVMIWVGRLPEGNTAPPEEVMGLLKYWLTVLGLAGALMVFATWDILDGVRTLRGYLENVEREEIGKIRQHLGDQDAGGLPTAR